MTSQTTDSAIRSGTGAQTYSSAIEGAGNYMRWLLGQFTPYLHGRIMETGLGHGGYVDRLTAYGSYVGVEIDADCVARARAAHPGIAFVQGDLCDRTVFDAPDLQDLDAIVSVNVLEHIRDDRRAIANLVGALRVGGHLLVSVPALPALYNDLDRLAGHHRRYTVGVFRNRLEGLPVRIVKLCYFNPIGGLGWWVNGFRSHSDLDSDGVNLQIRLFDRIIVPFSRLADPLFRRHFGQSLTCIVEKS